MQQYHMCHICGGEMYPILETEEYCYKGISVIVGGIRIFRCVNCGERILESEEAKRIEEILLAKVCKQT